MIRSILLSATALAAGVFSAAHADPQLGAATLPNARAGAVGDTLTVFGAIANSGDTNGLGCAPSVSDLPGTFGYRAVAADNQTFTAPANTPVDIPLGGAQNFLLTFTPSIALDEEDIDLVFDCTNALPAPQIDGVNSVLISADTSAGPDILPIIVTPSNDGVIRIPGQNRAQAASIAAVNIGAGTDIDVVVSADMGGLLGEPLSLGLCQTGSDGRCIDEVGNPAQTPPPPGQTAINATIGNTAATFSVFAYANQGNGVRFNPDLSRVHVRFFERAVPPVVTSELSRVTLARDPDQARTELSGVSGAALAPGRPPIPGEGVPYGIFQAVFESDDARGEGLMIAGPDGVIAGGFGLEQRAAPFDDASIAYFGLAVPAAQAGRFRVENTRVYDLGSDDPAAAYTLRGPFEPAHFAEGSLDPAPGAEDPRIFFRAQFTNLLTRDVPLAGLSGPYQLIADGRPLGSVSFDSGVFQGLMADGEGGTAFNCTVSGNMTRAGAATDNLFNVTATLATASGQAACAAAGTVSGLGFESDWPRAERGEIVTDMVTSFLEAPNNQGAVNVQFRPVRDTGFRVRRVTSGLANALFVTGLPGPQNRILVVRQTGQVHIVNPLTGAVDPDLFMDVSGSIFSEGESGLLGLALAPDFDTSGLVFVNVSNPAGDTEIRRYSMRTTDPDQVDPATGDVILTYAQPEANHNGGWIGFGPDGYLYIASGDGGGTGDPGNNAQNTANLLGAILRIDTTSDGYPADTARDYAIPADNPFASGGGRPEIWAYGLRNPFRASFDSETGDLIIGDVGQGVIEEIDVIPARQGGLNFGWNLREGTIPYNGGADSAGFTGPVAEYRHGSGSQQGRSVTGGYVYRGDIAALDGHYIFGDFVSGNIWSIPAEYFDADETIPAAGFIQRNADFTPDAGDIGNVSSFGMDADGAVYIVDYDGEIFRIEADE